LLAKGSFGEAWRAYDKEAGKDVVVKLFFRKDRPKYLRVKYIAKGSATSAETKVLAAEEWACRQVRHILQLAVQDGHRHPGAEHICNCIEESMEPPHAYLVQDFCGEALSEWRPEDERSRLKASGVMAYQMLSVLDLLAHADYPRTYIHHDLKPANVAVSWSKARWPSIRIIDWGAMRLLGAPLDPEDAELAGCVWNRKFAPPEWRFKQELPCAQEGLEYAYDVFAVGAMLGASLTGLEPTYSIGDVDFDWDAMQQLCAHQVPSTASDLVQRLTSTGPEERPPPAAAVLSPALVPYSRRWLLGSWRSSSTLRGYDVSMRRAGSVRFAKRLVELSVLTKGEVRGAAFIEEGMCDFIGPGANSSCCTVPVNYSSRKYTKFFGLRRRPYNISIEVELCPLSFWTVRFVERAAAKEAPRHFLSGVVPFRRAAA